MGRGEPLAVVFHYRIFVNDLAFSPDVCIVDLKSVHDSEDISYVFTI